MIATNGSHLNGIHTGDRALRCPSDYEERPIDATPSAPKPAWMSQHARYTEHVSWTDHDGVTHGLTIRSDSLQGLMADLRLIKKMIRQAKAQHAERTPEHSQPAYEPDSDVPPCKIHGVPMERRSSRRTGGVYWAHSQPGTKELCFGRAREA